MFITVIKD